MLLVLIPFLQVGGHQFIICDDNDYIFENPPVVQGVSAWGFWWAWDPHAGNWHPLTWLSHMVDWQAFPGLGRGGTTWAAWPSMPPAWCCCFWRCG